MKRRRLERLRRLSPAEWALLPQLVVLSLGIHVALLIAPLEKVAAALDRGARTTGLRRLPCPHLSMSTERLTVIADLATLVSSGRNRCLPRSLVLMWMMRARGEQVELVVGAAKAGCGELEGHAWIEVGGRMVLDTPSTTSRFSPFVRL
jgi:hypothetical protein